MSELSIEELQDKIKSLEKSNAFLLSKVNDFENGDKSLYHAVQRKMTQLSKILNKHDLADIDIDDAKNKTFDRISAILEKCEKYALSANALGDRIGVDKGNNGNSIIRRITPESMAQEIGDYKTANV